MEIIKFTPNANKTGYMCGGLFVLIAMDKESDFKLNPSNRKKARKKQM